MVQRQFEKMAFSLVDPLLKLQQCDVDGGFGGQQVAAVALVVALAMALVEQWQWWVRH